MGGVDTELIRTVTMSYILKQTHKLPKSPANILPQKTKYDEECWDVPEAESTLYGKARIQNE